MLSDTEMKSTSRNNEYWGGNHTFGFEEGSAWYNEEAGSECDLD